ncbi:Cof-type HAD-IIB family hydrolase [Evansella tamaricis]|uniref:Cof-type HAD-IIB family hydrolase n=1 Tax=Evansella tamaricis TaxID=2069301 RepID=A0ABS6JHG5_9BACI|nr:Cof-type HAD-IIB family hydrolase [Evansella tamaricis]MBU9713116.1 Cof-type HAD-IIB family hydrolase [Evansella tamaricis]
MNYKMIVLDMDDTLLLSNNTIGSHTKNALLKAQEKGVKVVLASGRPPAGMKKYAQELQLKKNGSFILAFNGAEIFDCQSDEELFSSRLSLDNIQELYRISQRENVYLHTFVGETIITEKNNPYTEVEGKLNKLPIKEVPNFLEFVKDPVVKLLMCAEPEKLIQVEKKLKLELQGRFNIMRSKPFFLEFLELGVSKGTSILQLIKQLGIKIDEVIAVGDSYNDLEMIELAGFGVAMGNAPDDIKEKADFVTDTNDNEGVASIVETFILNTNPPQ